MHPVEDRVVGGTEAVLQIHRHDTVARPANRLDIVGGVHPGQLLV